MNIPQYSDILWENVTLFLVYYKLDRDRLRVYQSDADRHLTDIYLAVVHVD